MSPLLLYAAWFELPALYCQIGRDAHDYWSDAIANFLRERDRLPRERVCDLNYAAIRRDAIGAIRHIYEHFDWPLSSETEERMRRVLANQSQTENGNHRYHPSQFGLEEAQNSKTFAAYCERFGLTERAKDAGLLVYK